MNSKMILKDDDVVLNGIVGCIKIYVSFSYFTYFIEMSLNFVYFVVQFGIQNPIILDMFKFFVPLAQRAHSLKMTLDPGKGLNQKTHENESEVFLFSLGTS